MIRLVERDSVALLEEYCAGDPFGCRIVAAERTYGTSESFAQFFLQYNDSNKIVAAIGRLDNGMTVCTRGGSDDEEIDAFVEMCVGKTGAVRPVRDGELATGAVMQLDRSLLPDSTTDFELQPAVEDVYTVLESCPGLGFEVPPFKEFYSDIRKRLRVGTASCALVRSGVMPASCAAVHIMDDVSLLTMCATHPKHRGKGYAAGAIHALAERRRMDKFFVMCLPGMADYYKKLGFAVIGGFRY